MKAVEMTPRLLLFDEIERDYLGPSGYSEPSYVFLNRTARPVFAYIRQILQDWFDGFDATESKREDILRDFRSEDDRKHLGAFFELYLQRLMIQLGFEVEVEPDWPEGTPDFLLTVPSGERILLEATSVFPERMFGSSKVFENKVLDEINTRVNSPNFFLNISIKSRPTNQLPYAKMCRHIEQELNKLEPDTIIRDIEQNKDMWRDLCPVVPCNYDGWDIEITAIPKSKDIRGQIDIRPIGIQNLPVEWVNTAARIKTRISEKYRRYGGLSIPYLLALNVHDEWFQMEEDVFEALYGTPSWVFSWESDEVIPQRMPDGAWFESHGYQKTRMSGLLVFDRLSPSEIGRVNPMLWHNPAAQQPIASEMWKLPQKIPNQNRYEDVIGIFAPDVLGVNHQTLVDLYNRGKRNAKRFGYQKP
jgi:hypothetical protein